MPLGITIVQLLYSKIKLFLPDSVSAVRKPGRADFGCILLPEISRPCGDPTESSKSRVCMRSQNAWVLSVSGVSVIRSLDAFSDLFAKSGLGTRPVRLQCCVPVCTCMLRSPIASCLTVTHHRRPASAAQPPRPPCHWHRV